MYLPAPTKTPKLNIMFSHITMGLDVDSPGCVRYFTIAILFYTLSWPAFVLILQDVMAVVFSHHICVLEEGRVGSKQLYLRKGHTFSLGKDSFFQDFFAYVICLMWVT